MREKAAARAVRRPRTNSLRREQAVCEARLPRWLREHEGEHVLVKGDEVLSIWDTQGDAIQAGSQRFGLDPIFVKTIDPRYPDRYALLDACLP